MAKVLLPGAVKRHVYSIDVTIEGGQTVKNRDQPIEDQIVGEIQTVPPDKKDQYLYAQTFSKSSRRGKKRKASDDVTMYRSKPTECTRMYLRSLKGLEDYNIKDGPSLADFPDKDRVVCDIIEETHLVACGIYKDPDLDDDEDEI